MSSSRWCRPCPAGLDTCLPALCSPRLRHHHSPSFPPADAEGEAGWEGGAPEGSERAARPRPWHPASDRRGPGPFSESTTERAREATKETPGTQPTPFTTLDFSTRSSERALHTPTHGQPRRGRAGGPGVPPALPTPPVLRLALPCLPTQALAHTAQTHRHNPGEHWEPRPCGLGPSSVSGLLCALHQVTPLLWFWEDRSVCTKECRGPSSSESQLPAEVGHSFTEQGWLWLQPDGDRGAEWPSCTRTSFEGEEQV